MNAHAQDQLDAQLYALGDERIHGALRRLLDAVDSAHDKGQLPVHVATRYRALLATVE